VSSSRTKYQCFTCKTWRKKSLCFSLIRPGNSTEHFCCKKCLAEVLVGELIFEEMTRADTTKPLKREEFFQMLAEMRSLNNEQ